MRYRGMVASPKPRSWTEVISIVVEMAAPLSAGAVAADIQRRDGPDADSLIAAFRSSPLDAKRILEQLAMHKDPAVRAWVPWAARRGLSKPDAVAIALRLFRDRDSDVRDVALDELVELDREAASKLAGTLRQRLKSKEFYEPIAAMWALAAIGDKASVDDIRANARTLGQRAPQKHGRGRLSASRGQGDRSRSPHSRSRSSTDAMAFEGRAHPRNR